MNDAEAVRNYYQEPEANAAIDQEVDAAIEALRVRICNPDDLVSRAETLETLDRYRLFTHRQLGYLELFTGNRLNERGYRETDRYELITAELVTGLTDYITSRLAELTPAGGSLKILEVGAGDGQLAQHVSRALDRRVPGRTSFRAVDNGVAGYPMTSIVECSDVVAAINETAPDVVIASWPPGDWTPLIRQQVTVQEYIILGDPAFCGDGQGVPGYAYAERDGFVRVELPSISAAQLGYHYQGVEGQSKTFSFRRVRQ